MTIKKLLHIILSIVLMSGLSYAHTPTTPTPIQPLPTLKVTGLTQKDGQMYMHREYVTHATEEIVEQAMFSFPELDARLEDMNSSSTMDMPMVDDPQFGAFMVALHKAGTTQKVKKIDTLVDKAIAIGNFIDKLTGGDLVTMPLVMKQSFGTKDLYIVFQSAKIYPTYAELEVYIKIDMNKKDFNNKPAILYFGAKDIKFSQDKGIIEGYVGLIADYGFRIGQTQDNAGIYLKALDTLQNGDDIGTYVKFDCDGFKEMGVGGAVFFSRNWMIPTDEFGVPRGSNSNDKSNTARVNGHFQFIAQDFNDFFINLSIDHFVLTKWDKMSFYLGNANLDLSTYRNPQNVPYPQASASNPEWQGVYVESMAITLPKQFKRVNTSFEDGGNQGQQPPSERIKISAEHLLIDEFGVYGNFSITGQAPLIGGPIMDGEWGWSLDHITVGLEQSKLDSFSFSGGLGVPILSKEGPLDYYGYYSKALNTYSFSVEQECTKKFPIWNAAQVDITSIGINFQITDNEFRPEVSFNGKLSIGNPNDYASSQQGSTVKLPSIEFTGLTLKTVPNYLSVQSIAISGGGGKVANFPVTISGLSLSSGGSNEVVLGFDLGINLMNEGSGVSATGSMALVGENHRDLNWSRRYKFKRFDFNGASVTISLPQFYANGQLCMFEDDPTYGKGFSAKVLAKIIGDNLATNDGKFKLFMGAIFGSTNGYRYWLVDGFLKSESLTVPIVPGVLELNGFGGGAFHHMRQAGYDPNSQGGQSGGCSGGFSDYAGIIYKPEVATKLGIKFSTSFTGSGGLLSGLLTCILRFGDGYSLQNIAFWGTAELLIKSDKAEKILKNVTDKMPDLIKSTQQQQADNKQKMVEESEIGGKIMANVGISLDFEGGFIFHTFAEVKINMLNNALKGSGTLDILADDVTKKWHLWLGGYYEPKLQAQGFFDDTPIELAPVSVAINYGGFSLSANAYFLTGNDIPGPPQLDPTVAAFFGVGTGENNRGKLTCDGNNPALGTGIAFGASCFFDFNKFKKGFLKSCFPGYKIDIGGAIGFDLALLKYDKNVMCGSGVPIGGINGLRATGRVYAFVNIESGHVICIPIPHFGVGLLLGFDVIKPSYLQGVVVLDFIKKMRLAAEFGDECGTPCTEAKIE